MYPESPDLVKYIGVPLWQFIMVIDVFDEAYLHMFFNAHILGGKTAHNAHSDAMKIVAEMERRGETKNGKPIATPDVILIGDGLPGAADFSIAWTNNKVSYVFMHSPDYGYYFSYQSNSEFIANFEAILDKYANG